VRFRPFSFLPVCLAAIFASPRPFCARCVDLRFRAAFFHIPAAHLRPHFYFFVLPGCFWMLCGNGPPPVPLRWTAARFFNLTCAVSVVACACAPSVGGLAGSPPCCGSLGFFFFCTAGLFFFFYFPDGLHGPPSFTGPGVLGLFTRQHSLRSSSTFLALYADQPRACVSSHSTTAAPGDPCCTFVN